MATYQILYWFDIPLQVRAKEGRTRYSQPLSERFQQAVDQASMAAGVTDSDSYLAQLNWTTPQSRKGSPEAVVCEITLELESRFEIIPWRASAEKLQLNPGKMDEK